MAQSIKANFMDAALHDHAATLSKKAMQSTFQRFQTHAKQFRYGDVKPETVTKKQLANYARERIEKGISPRTIQNEMSHLRRAMIGVGRGELAASWDNKSDFGIPAGSRTSDKRMVDPVVLAAAREAAAPDTRAWIDISRAVGLREAEIVQAHRSLKDWEKSLQRGSSFLVVQHGTKGGRLRDTFIAPENRERALEAVKACQEVMKDGRDYLVVSVSAESAEKQIRDRFAALGLMGENSAHSLRREFAVGNYKHYLREGLSEKESLARCSRDLGHGDGRGRWVKANYIKGTLAAEAE